MKILFTRFPLESRYGGAEIQTIALMKGLMAKGHAVAFLGSCPTLLRLTKEENIPRAELHIGPPPVSKRSLFRFFWKKKKMQAQLEAALNEFHDIDAICMLSLTEKLLLTQTAYKKNKKVLWIEHDRHGPWLSQNPWLPHLKKMSEYATTVAVSELSRRKYLELGWKPEHTVCIPNGIDLDRFQGTDVMPVTNRGALHLGTIARLSVDKGVDVLVEAIRDLHDVTLDIVGSGRDEGLIRTLIDDISKKEMLNVPRFRMFKSIPDPGAFYRSLDVFVLPSRDHDPFGLVAAEAMSLGIPTIVTEQCGIADELTHDYDALIASADEARSLKQMIVRLRSPERRKEMSEHAKQTAHEHFDLPTMIDAYDSLLRGKVHHN